MNSKELDILENMRLMDNEFMAKYFDNFIEGTTLLLNVILQRSDMDVIEVVSQREYKSLKERSIILDIYAEDSNGKAYDIEVQRENQGAVSQRARFYSSMLDTKLLKKGEKFNKLSDSYVIFITEKDVIGKGEPIYHIERKIIETDEYFNDGAHIIYVNGEYSDINNPIGKLMHDFKCKNAKDMYNPVLAERFRYFKETEGGILSMSEIMEQLIIEERKEIAKELLKLGQFKIEDVAHLSHLSVEDVKKLVESVSVKA